MSEVQKKPVFRRILGHAVTRIILGLAMLIASAMLCGTVLKLILPAFRGQAILSHFLESSLLILTFTGAYLAFVKWIERRRATELALKGSASGLGKGALISVGLVVFVYGILMLCGYLKITSVNPPSYMIVPFLLALQAGVTEELLIRGVMYRIIEEKLGTVWSLVITASLFGALHLLNPHATAMGAISIALTAGLMLALAYTYTQQLWMSIGLHVGWNFLTGGVFGTAVSGNNKMQALLSSDLEGPEIMTGGVFGPEASILIVIAGLAVSWVLYVKVKKEGKLVLPYWKIKTEERRY